MPLPARKWIDSNLENIEVKDPSNFSFAVFGGSRIGRLTFESLLKQLDHDPGIAFAIDLGDTVLKGRKTHYRHFIGQIDKNLGIPFLTVMGENDISGGKELYRRIFGPSYYSFTIGGNYFIILDNAENNSPDGQQTQWLRKELENSKNYESLIIFLHRPLYDHNDGNSINRRRTEDTPGELIGLLLNYRVSHIFASRDNGIYQGKIEGIPYTETGGAGAGHHRRGKKHSLFHFLKVNVEKGNVNVGVETDYSRGIRHVRHARSRPLVFLDSMIRVHWPEVCLIIFILLTILIYIVFKQKARKRNAK